MSTLGTCLIRPVALLALLSFFVVGCNMSGDVTTDGGMSAGMDNRSLVGTWRGEDGNDTTAFQFASVTFAPDGTYTAQMRYSGQTRADSGKWSVTGDTLRVEENRSYRFKVEGNQVTFTDPQSNVSQTLTRLR